MTFSEMTKDWYWISCGLCGKNIAMIKDKLKHDEGVLCGPCLLTELKIESQTIELENENRKKR